MTEKDAYKIAVGYLLARGTTYYRCYSIRADADREMPPSCFPEDDPPAGVRQKVWSFAFTFVEPEPNVVVSGGDGVVYVDDETGACSYFMGL